MQIQLETPKQIIEALRNSKKSEDTKSIVQYVSKEYFSDELLSGSLSMNLNEESQDVKTLQTILVGLSFLKNNDMTGKLDQVTMNGLKSFAQTFGVSVDVNQPVGKSIIDLFTTYKIQTDVSKTIKYNPSNLPKEAYEDKYNWPPKPDQLTYLSQSEAQKIYGPIEYKPKGSGDSIIITNNFERDNIITITIPQLAKIQHPRSTQQRCHKLAARQIIALWQEWENLGLLSRIITFNGLYNPRFIRGSKTTLSNHAFGVAFDINTKYNGLYQTPPAVGEKGSLRELVPSALKWGFFWGGHYKNRKDGMHFELKNPQAAQYIV
jgi:hypothetical protein